jgi:hypothetical protein
MKSAALQNVLNLLEDGRESWWQGRRIPLDDNGTKFAIDPADQVLLDRYDDAIATIRRLSTSGRGQ